MNGTAGRVSGRNLSAFKGTQFGLGPHSTPLVVGNRLFAVTADADESGRTRLRLATPAWDYGTVPLSLRGRHQVDNAVLATRLVEELGRAGPVSAAPPAIAAGLMTTRWPGLPEDS